MRKIYLALLFLSLAALGKAQFIVPHDSLVLWFQQNYPQCIQGNVLDTNCTALNNPIHLYTNFRKANNLNGIQFFRNLQTLQITGSFSINSLPVLPKKLRTFICTGKNLTQLPPLPPRLRHLDVESNQLTSLPTLPDTLQILNVRANGPYNSTFQLPSLPNTLITLDISYLKINTVGLQFPNSLRRLFINNTRLLNGNQYPLSLPDNLRFLAMCNQTHNLTQAGQSIAIDVNEAFLPPALDTLSFYGNYNGINLTYFSPQLTYIELSFCSLQSLPPLPQTLKTLIADNNNLTALPTLPHSLKVIDCSFNPLGSFNLMLNPGLESLMATNCQLQNYPDLPNSLISANLSNNPFGQTTVSFSPSLRFLNLNNCQLSNLPPLPPLLEVLNVSNNQLSSLSPLASPLRELLIGNNLFTSVNSGHPLPTSLRSLICSSNPLDSLQMLNNGLQNLTAQNCGLTSLYPPPASLRTLEVSSNQLTALPILNHGLQLLRARNNQINTIVNFPSTLVEIAVQNNQLEEIPPYGNISTLRCENNQIKCFHPFPPNLGQWNLQAFNISNNSQVCLPNYIQIMNSYPALLALPLCTNNPFINPYQCPEALGVSGTAYDDQNNNCTFQGQIDAPMRNVPVSVHHSTTGNLIAQSLTLNNGVYQFILPFGHYQVRVDTASVPLRITCPDAPSFHNFNLTGAQPNTSNKNFPLECADGYDLGIQSIVPLGWVFPGQNHLLKLKAGDFTQWFGLNCATNIEGQVRIHFDGPVQFFSPANNALSPQWEGDTLVYSIADFGQIVNNQAFNMFLKVDTTAQAGQIVCANVYVLPNDQDLFPNNNQWHFCYDVVNSYDPNIITVYPDTVAPYYHDWLTYTIYFQNTGSAPAFNIRVLDTLDVRLDRTTMEILDYSHPVHYQITNRVVNFYFNNIMLPDSISDPEGSIGYVQYRVKPMPNVANGNIVPNRAHIYFDFNEPITTNTSKVVFYECTNTQSYVTQNTCGSYYFHGELYTESGIYERLITNAEGCDSLITLELNIHGETFASIDTTVCNTFKFLHETYYQSGVYTTVIPNVHGCDSTITIYLTSYGMPNYPEITWDGSSLHSDYEHGNQWYINGLSIPGATEQSYQPTQSGTYTVQYTIDQCQSYMSPPFHLFTTGVNTASNLSPVAIYPNPANENFTLETMLLNEMLSLADATGRIVHQQLVNQSLQNIDVQALASGIYTLSLGSYHAKLVIKH